MPTLRDLREDALMTQAEFARACNVSQQTVSEWENGRVVPSIKNRRKLVEVLGKTPKEVREAIQATAEAAKKMRRRLENSWDDGRSTRPANRC